jgi:hypothetical protein
MALALEQKGCGVCCLQEWYLLQPPGLPQQNLLTRVTAVIRDVDDLTRENKRC